MTIPEFLGWLTTFFFNISYAPQIYKILKTKKVDDLSLGFIILLMCAYVSGLIYSLSIVAWPIVFSHVLGILCVSILLYLKLRPR